MQRQFEHRQNRVRGEVTRRREIREGAVGVKGKVAR